MEEENDMTGWSNRSGGLGHQKKNLGSGPLRLGSDAI